MSGRRPRAKVRPINYIDTDITESEEHNFFILLEATLAEPEKVKDIVAGTENILAARNSIGENALHYLAVENKLEEVKMLRSFGSEIPPYSIVEDSRQTL